MAETSRFWNGTTLGDATIAPYDAQTEFANILRDVSGAAWRTDGNGLFGVLNQYATTGAASPLSVASGRALVDGTWHESTAAVSVVVPTPGGATRVDVICLIKDFVAQTVRVGRYAGVEGAGVPVPPNVVGTAWYFPLYNASITTGGVITLTDRRIWLGGFIVPEARVFPSIAVSIPNTTTTAIAFNSESYDTDQIHDNVTNNTRLTCKTAGKYHLTATIEFAANATGYRFARITPSVGIGGIDSRMAVTIGDVTTCVIACDLDMAVNDYAEVQVFQTSGGALNVSTNCHFEMHRVG